MVNRVPAIKNCPTAVHALFDVHDTPFREFPGALVAFGVLWIVQLVPFQRSASVESVPALLV